MFENVGDIENNIGPLLDCFLRDLNPIRVSEITPKYSIQALLVILKSTGEINPILLAQLSKNLLKNRH
jgi:hypothetical protein